MFRRDVRHGCMLTALQGAQVTNDCPAILHHDARSVSHHGVLAVRDGIENFSVRHVANPVVLQSDDRREAILLDDTVPGCRPPRWSAKKSSCVCARTLGCRTMSGKISISGRLLFCPRKPKTASHAIVSRMKIRKKARNMVILRAPP